MRLPERILKTSLSDCLLNRSQSTHEAFNWTTQTLRLKNHFIFCLSIVIICSLSLLLFCTIIVVAIMTKLNNEWTSWNYKSDTQTYLLTLCCLYHRVVSVGVHEQELWEVNIVPSFVRGAIFSHRHTVNVDAQAFW